MALSAEAVTRFTTEVDIDWRFAFVLTHPTAGTLRIINAPDYRELNVDGFTQPFFPVPSQVVMPGQDDSGTEQTGIVWSCIGTGDGSTTEDFALQYLRTAIQNPQDPIECRITIYFDGDPDPQIDPWYYYSLTNVTVSEEAIAAVATRADMLNRSFPREIYKVQHYPGLQRR